MHLFVLIFQFSFTANNLLFLILCFRYRTEFIGQSCIYIKLFQTHLLICLYNCRTGTLNKFKGLSKIKRKGTHIFLLSFIPCKCTSGSALFIFFHATIKCNGRQIFIPFILFIFVSIILHTTHYLHLTHHTYLLFNIFLRKRSPVFLRASRVPILHYRRDGQVRC